VRKLRDSDGNVDLNDQPCSGRPVTATDYVNRQKVYNLLKKNERISQRAIAENLNTSSAHVSEILQDWLAKKRALDGCPVSLRLK
jgi:predicted HTH transcriptional regulator